MFFELVRKNSRKNRKENGLLFMSLVVSIIAFYIILSLENQDVMVFLRTMESDAVNRLLGLIPVMYGVTLFILFFLVYFAGKYHMEKRSHELGIYLMLGMRRGRLLVLLLAEELWNSVLSLIVGIPTAVFLSEMISLITARAVGIGIIGHHFSFSPRAVVWTIAGYFAVRLAALVILSGSAAGKEIVQLLSGTEDKRHKRYYTLPAVIKVISGIVLLGCAYAMGITGMSWSSVEKMGLTAVLGIAGTFLFFRGIGVLFSMVLKRKKDKNGLSVFTFRQLQEAVFHKSSSLAVSSLLVLTALCCFGYGVGVSLSYQERNNHVTDYTFQGEGAEIEAQLESLGLKDDMKDFFEVRTGAFDEDESGASFSAKGLIDILERQKDSRGKEVLLNNLQYFDYPYLISLSGYNHILQAGGKEPVELGEKEAVFYVGKDFSNGDANEALKAALKENAYVEINGEKYELAEQYLQENLVTDRSINIQYALVVTDSVFDKLLKGEYSTYWNASLKDELVEKEGMIGAIEQVNRVLNQAPLTYESYLQNIGRQMFYTVAASYTTIYLAVVFLIVSNTVMGVQFLLQQQKNKKRYQTVIRLGCQSKELCKSARKQVGWYFFLPVITALAGSAFGVMSLLTGVASQTMSSRTGTMIKIAIPMIILLFVVEFIYILAVMKMSDRRIRRLIEIKREED